ncbi:MAG: SPOR domain-containing protein [Candidatus Margulisiibacteriota bacterium]
MEAENLNPAPKIPSNLPGSIKNIFLLLILVLVVIASFWISFKLGERILVPTKKQSDLKIKVAIPEPPPSIAGLQKAGIVTPEAVKKVTWAPVCAPRKTSGLYKVQVGAFKNKSNAQKLLRTLKAKGIDAVIVRE